MAPTTTDQRIRRYRTEGETLRTELGRRVYVLTAAEIAGGPTLDVDLARRLGAELDRLDRPTHRRRGCTTHPLVDVINTRGRVIAVRACNLDPEEDPTP